jgi:hypothetical protein
VRASGLSIHQPATGSRAALAGLRGESNSAVRWQSTLEATGSIEYRGTAFLADAARGGGELTQARTVITRLTMQADHSTMAGLRMGLDYARASRPIRSSISALVDADALPA